MPVNEDILGVLTPGNLAMAYAHGVFPMVEDGELLWFSPDPRGLMPIDELFHVSRRLRRTIRSGRLACTIDRCFDRVVAACAAREGEPTWISPEIRLAYDRLHRLGLAHSVETWRAGSVGRGAPVGGLYGVTLGGAFFAESMFHTVTDAGKVALVHLVERLSARGFRLCDVQWFTENLRRFGAYEVSRAEYLAAVTEAIGLKRSFV